MTATHIDCKGRVAAVRKAGAVQTTLPARGMPDQITYDGMILHDVYSGPFTAVVPSGRVTTTVEIDSAMPGDSCDVAINLGAASPDIRVYVRETIVFSDCEPGGQP